MSHRVAQHNEEKNEKGIRLQLDLLDEVRVIAEQWIARYRNLMARHYNAKIKP